MPYTATIIMAQPLARVMTCIFQTTQTPIPTLTLVLTRTLIPIPATMSGLEVIISDQMSLRFTMKRLLKVRRHIFHQICSIFKQYLLTTLLTGHYHLSKISSNAKLGIMVKMTKGNFHIKIRVSLNEILRPELI